MNAPRIFLVASLVIASSASLVTRQDALLTSLLKRQEPGTPAYNCHDNCGSAIKLSRVADPCNNAVFIADYKNCLKCSGSDNYNIWRYYGGSLSNTGAKCGLDTEPVSGKQEDVPPAGSTGAAPSDTPTQTATIATSSTVTSAGASAAEASAAPTQSSVSGPLSSAAVATIGEPSEAPVSSATTTTVTTSAVPSDPVHSTVVADVTLSSFVAGETSPSSNASASSTASAPAQVTVNSAGSLHAEGAASVFGAIFIGAIFGM